MDANSIVITVFFYVKKGQEEKFLEYEKKVLPLLENYGGEIVFRWRPGNADYAYWRDEAPFEVHMLSFGSSKELSNYLKDEIRIKNTRLFQESILKTVLFEGSLKSSF